MKIKNSVFITHTSSVSCSGENSEALFQSIIKGESGIRGNSTYFEGHRPAIGKIPSGLDFSRHLAHQCQSVLDASNLSNFEETLLLIGSSVGGMNVTEEIFFRTKSYKEVEPELHNINEIAYQLKQKFHFYDDISFSTACTSSANAIGYAYEVISKGIYKNVLVVGADALSYTTIGGFLSLGVLSSQVCRPFDTHRDGMNVSEAVACLLLQTEPEQGAVELCGVGYSSDAYHMTHPHPEGVGAQMAMKRALESAGIKPEQIDYVNAHGTGTIANDKSEAHAISKVFPHRPPVSSSKSITGHSLGAAGALEAVISCMAIRHQMILPNTFLENPENDEVNFPTTANKKEIRYVLSNSFAFGGNNCSLVFGRIS